MLRAVHAHAGQPAAPHDLISAWRPDWFVVTGLVLVCLLYLQGRSRSTRPPRNAPFAAGIAAVAVALLSPLETASGSLASAHMVQHVLLVLVGAPLLALGRALPTVGMGLPIRLRRAWWRLMHGTGLDAGRRRWLQAPLLALAVYAIVFWFWHAAVPYQAALESDFVHAAEHLSFLATALLFWQAVLIPDPAGRGLRVLAVFGAAMQGTLLSALLTFAPRPWYGGYVDSAPLWGLDPLTDQQLAGLLMWVPGGLVYTAAALAILTGWLRRLETDPTRSVGASLQSR
ncbi:MAG TPA: cytochrome c oxidase assembly protein [Acidimicrobiia bacterium]|nr:cytochrome c oxidase assembly protein [Acidimicrobiia bacterium]